ncbi:unnamed protein product [Angiostrongylus costaricensis]|uniref:Ovule protein n=1 Tax=Angiostrongylus costaricensis TaxID=334426 RepID=A0A0R3PF80_ANGCS|nr:unnamed protein product [Angiostrongylus costaricensis]
MATSEKTVYELYCGQKYYLYVEKCLMVLFSTAELLATDWDEAVLALTVSAAVVFIIASDMVFIIVVLVPSIVLNSSIVVFAI